MATVLVRNHVAREQPMDPEVVLITGCSTRVGNVQWQS